MIGVPDPDLRFRLEGLQFRAVSALNSSMTPLPAQQRDPHIMPKYLEVKVRGCFSKLDLLVLSRKEANMFCRDCAGSIFSYSP